MNNFIQNLVYVAVSPPAPKEENQGGNPEETSNNS